MSCDSGSSPISRRSLLHGLAGLLASSYCPGLAFAEVKVAGAGVATCEFAAILGTDNIIGPFLSAASRDKNFKVNPEDLIERLIARLPIELRHVRGEEGEFALLVFHIRGAIAQDLSENRIVPVDGWLFTETELALAYMKRLGTSC